MKLPAGWPASVLLGRALLFVLPLATLLLALPRVPHWSVILLVLIGAGEWARSPDHVAGAVVLVLVIGWWTAHGVTDWRVPVVAVLLVLAHVIAIVLAHGPGTMPIDPDLAILWLRRGALSLLPLGVAFVAIRGLDADLAPPWLWMMAALVAAGLTLATTRMTRTESE